MNNRTPFVKVPLTKGKVALVSPEDAERVLRHKWHARRRGGDDQWIATSSMVIDGRRRRVRLHRFVTNAPLHLVVDHRNGNPLDCRQGNLRPCTSMENSRNSRRQRWGSNRYKGAYRIGRTKKWKALITVNGKSLHLGTFVVELDAALAFDEAARCFHGEFACVNFPHDGERRAG